MEFNLQDPLFRKLFPELVEEYQRKKQLRSESAREPSLERAPVTSNPVSVDLWDKLIIATIVALAITGGYYFLY